MYQKVERNVWIFFLAITHYDQSKIDMVKLLRVYGECLGAERR